MSQQECLARTTEWANRQIKNGHKGFELLVRDGPQMTLIDRYPADKNGVEGIVADAYANADGAELPVTYMLRAVGDGAGPGPSRTIIVPPSAVTLHEPERYQERNIVRLLLENNDKQNRVISQVVPACLAAMGGMVQGLSNHFGSLAATHEAALRVLRDSHAERLEGERAMMVEAGRQQRVDKMLDVGMAMLPQVLDKLGNKDNK